MFPLQREKRLENNTWWRGGLWDTKWLTAERVWHEITLVRETLAGCGRGQSVRLQRWRDNTGKKSSSTIDKYILWNTCQDHVMWRDTATMPSQGMVITVASSPQFKTLTWTHSYSGIIKDVGTSASGEASGLFDVTEHIFSHLPQVWHFHTEMEVLVSLCPKHCN